MLACSLTAPGESGIVRACLTPSGIAVLTTIALLGWPFVVFALFSARPVAGALIWSIVLGYLFLPEDVGFNFPGLPDLNKTSIPAIAILLAYLIFGRRKVREAGPALEPNGKMVGRLLLLFIAMLVISPVLTMLGNQDSLQFGVRFLPGIRPWDVLSTIGSNMFMIIPYFMARRHLATPEAHRQILEILLICGLGYSILVLIEVRLSPQINVWVYGYFQHSFLQHMREGGFRPIVFLRHGLWVGLFLFSVAIAALSLWRGAAPDKKKRLLAASIGMTVVLSMSHNLGATVLFYLLALVVIFASPVAQARVALFSALLLLSYPALRQADLLPLDTISSMAAKVSEARAGSFQFRLDNEDALMARAQEKPVVGWGGWGRARVYNERGQDLSVTDGLWIIVLGGSGWFGYIAYFGLLTLPLLLLLSTRKRKPIPVETAGMAMIMAGNMIYLIPNSALSPIGWLMAGSLVGYAQYDVLRKREVPEAEGRNSGPVRSPYSRFGGGAVPAGGAVNAAAPLPGTRPEADAPVPVREAPSRRRGDQAPSFHRRATSTP